MSAPHWILTSYCLIFRHGPPSTATSTLSLHDALPITQSVLKKGSQAALFSLAALELLERATRSKPDPKREPLIDLLPLKESTPYGFSVGHHPTRALHRPAHALGPAPTTASPDR